MKIRKMGKDDSIRTICKTIGSLSFRVEQHGPHIRQPVTVLCPLIRVPDVIDPLPWDASAAVLTLMRKRPSD